MAIDWTDESEAYKVRFPWTVQRVSNWKRELSAAYSSHRNGERIDRLVDTADMADLYVALSIADDVIRDRHGLPTSGRFPEWVLKHCRS